MTVRAVIVGIEKYDDSRFDVSAPAANALAMAKWAIAHGVAPDHILLFVSSLDSAHTVAIEALGIQVRGTRKYDVETALGAELGSASNHENEDLLIYWCGHGMTDAKGQRLLFFSDYSDRLTDRVFNASLFIRDLRTDDFDRFYRQLFLADVCGTNSAFLARPADYVPKMAQPRQQLAYFATPEGGYALAGTGEGAFTFHALRVLEEFAGFPKFDEFALALDKELAASGLERFLVDARDETDELPPKLYGRASTTGDVTANSLVELLVRRRIVLSDAQHSFRATVSALHNPRLLAAQGITGMVRELSALRDLSPSATHGLVQFVLRLGEALPVHKEALEDWLAKWAEQATIDDETVALASERARNALIIDALSDNRGEISTLVPMLRSLDLTQTRGPRLDPVEVASWSAVEAGVQNILKVLRTAGFSDLTIHFIVDSTVFDRPFHRLSGLDGNHLGEEFGVVLHHRSRIHPTPSVQKRAWFDRAKAVSSKSTKNISWTHCPLGKKLPLDADFCLTDWPPNGPEKMVLDRLVRLGVPFLYWPHEAEGDPEPELTQIVRSLGALSAMPDAIRDKRLADVVSTGSLLWDEIGFNPYGGLNG